jgi:5-methylcytosine-specific restriction protein A
MPGVFKQCKKSGCSEVISSDKRYCEKHQHLQEEDDKKKEEWKRKAFSRAKKSNEELYNTTLWRQLRAQKLKDFPCCLYCASTDRLEIHHLIPPRGNKTLFYDYDNLAVLCKRCHQRETAYEVKQRKNQTRFG